MSHINDVISALQRAVDAQHSHNKAMAEGDGVSWDYYGYYYIKDMENAQKDFENALTDYIDEKIDEKLNYIDERIDEKLKEKKNGNG